VGVDPPPDEDKPDGGRDRLGARGRIIVGIAFFLLYAVSFTLRGEPLPGIVGGVLGGILVYLVFKEVEERSRRRRR
jgi:hypothetical protein